MQDDVFENNLDVAKDKSKPAMSNAQAAKELNALGFDTFSKRIVNHSGFVDCKFTHWQSVAIKFLNHADRLLDIDYDRFAPLSKPLFTGEDVIEDVSVEEFLSIANKEIVDIQVRFTDPIQALVMYTESLSARSVYAWDNNWFISHLANNYNAEGRAAFTCPIGKYQLSTELWYPINVIAHAPWFNQTTGETDIINKDYICLGIDQSPLAKAIGKQIVPDIDDITNVSNCPDFFMKEALQPYVDNYNDQMAYEVYKFDQYNKTGWLFVALDGFVFSRQMLFKLTNKQGKTRMLKVI
jgi:hypothetical protein